MNLKELLNLPGIIEFLLGVLGLVAFRFDLIPKIYIELIWLILLFVWLIQLIIICRNKHKLHFTIFGKCRDPVKAEPTNSEPVDSDWIIRVHSPNRPAKKCKILLNNKDLPWWDKKELDYGGRDIKLGDGGNVRIPRNEFPDAILWHAEGEIIEGKKTREKFRFAELKDVCKRRYGT